jgi:CRISPR type III-B/RAMP module-associated protein Cmr5
MATLEQRRARFALEKIDKVKGGGDKGKYKTQLLKLPARLHSNGLGQTVAFYLSAGSDKPETRICEWIEEWLRQRIDLQGRGLLGCIIGESAGEAAEATYRAASAEARALAVWLKRFAEAFIEGEGEPK